VRRRVITGDIATTRDAGSHRRPRVPALQINTGAVCHIEAHQIARAADDLKTEKLDLLIHRKRGQFVCPRFDLGEHDKVMMLSCTGRPRQAGEVPAHVPGVARPHPQQDGSAAPHQLRRGGALADAPAPSTPASKSSRCRRGRAMSEAWFDWLLAAWQPPSAP